MNGSTTVAPRGNFFNSAASSQTGFSLGCLRPRLSQLTTTGPRKTPSSLSPAHPLPPTKIISQEGFQGNDKSPIPKAGPLSQTSAPRVPVGAPVFQHPKQAQGNPLYAAHAITASLSRVQSSPLMGRSYQLQ